jgi:hypothetical protein
MDITASSLASQIGLLTRSITAPLPVPPEDHPLGPAPSPSPSLLYRLAELTAPFTSARFDIAYPASSFDAVVESLVLSRPRPPAGPNEFIDLSHPLLKFSPDYTDRPISASTFEEAMALREASTAQRYDLAPHLSTAYPPYLAPLASAIRSAARYFAPLARFREELAQSHRSKAGPRPALAARFARALRRLVLTIAGGR